MRNTSLIDYGIHTEDSHLRAHVCVITKTVYVYPTENGVITIRTDKYPLRSVWSNINGQRIKTAEGYAVPPHHIENCYLVKVIGWLEYVWKKTSFSLKDTTSLKGQKAAWLVSRLIKHGMFPVPLVPFEVTDKMLQVKGADIIINSYVSVRIQVKCDYQGGAKEWGGTGNLFLQVSECNPLRAY